MVLKQSVLLKINYFISHCISMSEGSELWFHCSCPLPTRLTVFNKQAGHISRSCCLISLCSTLWGCDVLCHLLPGAPVAEAQPGHHLLPSKGKQKICKSASSWILSLQGELCSSSAGSLRRVPWLQQWPAADASAINAGSWTKLSIFCPIVWDNAVIWTQSNSISSRQMQGLNDWRFSTTPTPLNLFYLPLRQKDLLHAIGSAIMYQGRLINYRHIPPVIY